MGDARDADFRKSARGTACRFPVKLRFSTSADAVESLRTRCRGFEKDLLPVKVRAQRSVARGRSLAAAPCRAVRRFSGRHHVGTKLEPIGIARASALSSAPFVFGPAPNSNPQSSMASLVGATCTVAPVRGVRGSRVSQTRNTVTRAASAHTDGDTTVPASPAVTRRAALSAVTASVASIALASPAFAGIFDGLSLPDAVAGDVKAKRVINLPKLEVDPISAEEGYPLTNGGDKGKAQQQYLKFIEPIINDAIDLPFGEYMRLALHDSGSFNVVGKKNGANGSIRFELGRPENAGVKEAFASIEKIKAKIDKVVTQPISYADCIAIVPHFAARLAFKKYYFEEMGPDDPNFEFLFVGTNPYLGAKIRVGRRDASEADPEGLIPGDGATSEELTTWFKRMGLGPNQLCMFAPFLYKDDSQKGLDLASQDGVNRAVLDQYASQRKLGKRAPGPAVTIIKNFKVMTDNCIPGGNPYVGGDRNPPYVEYARIRGGGEIPRVTTFGAYPGSADLGSSKFAQKVRGDR